MSEFDATHRVLFILTHEFHLSNSHILMYNRVNIKQMFVITGKAVVWLIKIILLPVIHF